MARRKDKGAGKPLAWFKLFIHDLKMIRVMQPVDVGNALIAVANDVCEGKKPENLKPRAQVLYEDLMESAEDGSEDYQKRCLRNRENGKKHKARSADGSEPNPNGNPVGSDSLPDGGEERRKEERGTEERSTEERGKTAPGDFVPPTPADVALFCQQEALTVDAARFVDYYQAIGWHQGSNRIRDWKACVRNWARREQTPPQPSAAVTAEPVAKASPIAQQAIARMLEEEAAGL